MINPNKMNRVEDPNRNETFLVKLTDWIARLVDLGLTHWTGSDGFGSILNPNIKQTGSNPLDRVDKLIRFEERPARSIGGPV
jgi:hypothetical protein